jgi:flagellar biosynthesis/type III secretory pathway M-ring protein FliF/YscJ
MMDNINSNQTQFAAQEPVMESLASYADEVPVEKAEPKKKKNKLVLIGVIGFILIVVFILLLILIRAVSKKEKATVDENGNVIESINGEIDPMLNEVYILSEDLELADPSLNTIPFPPVDMELRLDPKKRKQ